MGNNLGRRRQVVEDKYTRPQGLYQHKDVDHKKLKMLILDSKLAPCYAGDDECSSCDLEECPICFLYYPSLNRSRCCRKGICTECFLQMKTPNSARPTQCPFCKTPIYAVEYRGVKTKEEKDLEQIEEQLVIEAKIKMRQEEVEEEEEEEEVRKVKSREVGYNGDGNTYLDDDDFDIGLEDIMVMEAIWLSIQESRKHEVPGCSSKSCSEEKCEDQCTNLVADSLH